MPDLNEMSVIIAEIRKDTQRALSLAQTAIDKVEIQDSKICKIEEVNKLIYEMNTNIKVMIEQNTFRDEKLDEVRTDVKELKDKPAKITEKVRWIVATVVTTSLTGYVISHIASFLV